MDNCAKPGDKIDFFVGAELRLKDLLDPADVEYLLKSLISAGADYAAISDGNKAMLRAEGTPGDDKKSLAIKPFSHEGEVIGYLIVSCPSSFLKALADISFFCLDNILRNSAKRMLTTELHTTAVQQTYEELLEMNRQLAASEKQYRDLAQTLELKVEERTSELKRAYARLLQQEKMASIGQLAAGIAHEINNPMGFINSNLNTFSRYLGNLNEMLDFLMSREPGTSREEADELYRKLKIGLIKNDAPDLIRQSIDGAGRVKKIVINLKGFSHIDETADRGIEINEEIDNTLSVLSNEIKNRSAEIIKEYGELPLFFGNPGLICQVFLNILMNALQSKESGPVITIATGLKDDDLIVSISDNGKGIPPESQSRIFEPFFTTQEVGKGTGLGLAVSYEIVTSYKGTIEVKSEPGKGSTFIVTLPFTGERNV